MAEFFLDTINDADLQDNDFTLIPDGKYICQLESTDKKQTKKGKCYLEFCFKIIEGNLRGRKIWERFFCFEPEKVTAMKYAKIKIDQMCKVAGIQVLRDTSELEGTNYLLTVKTEESEAYGKQNSISKYEPVPAVNIQAADTSSVPW